MSVRSVRLPFVATVTSARSAACLNMSRPVMPAKAIARIGSESCTERAGQQGDRADNEKGDGIVGFGGGGVMVQPCRYFQDRGTRDDAHCQAKLLNGGIRARGRRHKRARNVTIGNGVEGGELQ